MKTNYAGTVYIGVVGPEQDHGVCRDSIQAMVRRPGDSAPLWIRATKGFEARQAHLDNFIDKTHHDFLLLLDHDQVFPADTLERLRSHGLPYVSGLYMRRQYQPIAPVWFKPYRAWPYEPWTTEIPTEPVKIGASGWGCILIHRDVVLAVRDILKGEKEIIEDDMDIYPYDLDRVMQAVNGLQELVEEQPPDKTLRAALAVHSAALSAELRPLRGEKSNVGSDLRFPFFALQAGFQLWGDPNVNCGHILAYPLSPDDYRALSPEQMQAITRQHRISVMQQRRIVAARVRELEQL